MWKDLRGFLEVLKEKGQLEVVQGEVDPKYLIAAYIRKTSDLGGPAFLFNRVKGYEDWRYVAGIYSSRHRIATALEVSEDRIMERFRRAVLSPSKTRVVDDGPCKEIVLREDEVDLYRLPVSWHSERDPSPYITSGVEIARDPETNVRLLGMHRLQLKGRDKLGFWAPGEKRLGRAYLKSEEKNRPLEIAIAIGNDPRIDLASQAKVPHDVDKMEIACSLRGEPIEMTKCETIEVDVPVNSEVIIEGEIMPHVREPEGPFGEVTGCYSGEKVAPVIKVKGISMREKPLFHTVLAGTPPTENNCMIVPAMLEAVYRYASIASPEVKAVNVTGNCCYTVLISMKKRVEKEPYNAIASVLGGTYQTKYCYVFDDDIDIYNPNDVEWAIQTRVQPHKDVFIFPIMVGAPLDPSAPMERHTSKMGVDATIPLGVDRSKFEKVRVPRVNEVKW